MKYSKEQLKKMAKVVIDAKQTNMPNYMRFIMCMCSRTGLTPGEVQLRIQQLAQ